MQTLHTFLWQYCLLSEFRQHYPLIKMSSANCKIAEIKINGNIKFLPSFFPTPQAILINFPLIDFQSKFENFFRQKEFSVQQVHPTAQ